MARRLFYLLGKVATNRDQIAVSYPDYKVKNYFDKGSFLWLGHDAIRWAREDPKRMLAWEGSGRDFGWRPLDDGSELGEAALNLPPPPPPTSAEGCRSDHLAPPACLFRP